MPGGERKAEQTHKKSSGAGTIKSAEDAYTEFDLFNPTEEHALVRQLVRDFVRAEVEPQAAEFDKREQFNTALFRKLGELHLLGITVPEKFGGAGMDPTAVVIVHEELSKSDPGFCLAYLAHSMLCVNNLTVNADDEQLTKFLPRLISGERIGAMAMTEPGVGTDVLGMATKAIRDGEHFVINGRKTFITNGIIDEAGSPCDLVLVYARTGEKRSDLSTFVVEKGTPGFGAGQVWKDKHGMRASKTAELLFDNCKVPAANLIGAEGDSLVHMMRNLEIERLSLAAMSIGIGLRSLEIMNRYASERRAFGRELRDFGQIQEKIGMGYAHLAAARTYVYDTARRLKLGSESKHRLDSDGVKLVAAPIAKRIADDAVQVLGGYGYMGDYVVERLLRDAKLLEIGGGTLEAHQKNIARELQELA